MSLTFRVTTRLMATCLLTTSVLAADSSAKALMTRGFTDLKVDRDGEITHIKVGGKGQVFTNQDLELLKNEKRLVSVEVSGDFSAVGVANLVGKATIEKLVLGSSAMTDEVSETVATLTGLKELRLFGNLTSEWGTSLTGKLPNLESVTVNGRDPDGRFTFPRDTAAAFRCLLSFPKFRAFNPGQHHIYYINNEVIATLAQCPNLEILNMGGNTWGGDHNHVDYRPLLACKKLHTFVQFHSSLYHDPTCATLAQLPEMRRITLDFVTDAGVEELAKLPKLERLTLGDSLISPEGIKALRGCKSLRQLEITGPWSYALLDALKEMDQLTSLSWSACHQGSAAETALRSGLPNTKLTLGSGDAVSIQESWDKATTRIRSKRQFAAFLKASETYQAAFPLRE